MMDEDDLYTYSMALEELLEQALHLLREAAPQVDSELCDDIAQYLDHAENSPDDY